jgi:hypothetical protein
MTNKTHNFQPYNKDGIDAEMIGQADAIKRIRSIAGNVRTLGSGGRTLKVRMTQRKQTPACSQVVLANAERRTGLTSDATYCLTPV